MAKIVNDEETQTPTEKTLDKQEDLYGIPTATQCCRHPCPECPNREFGREAKGQPPPPPEAAQKQGTICPWTVSQTTTIFMKVLKIFVLILMFCPDLLLLLYCSRLMLYSDYDAGSGRALSSNSLPE